jgi:hypothetical protein
MNKIILAALFFILLSCTDAFACVCLESPSVCDIYQAADAVIVGKIEKIEKARVDDYDENMYGQKVKVRVIKSFKGANREFITLAQPDTSCDMQFDEADKSKEYLLYLDLNKKTNFYKVFVCGRSGETKEASNDLSWLKGLPKSLERNRLSGVLSLYENSDRFTFVDYLVGTKIKISGEKKSFEVLTDKNGMFETWDLPPGKYNVKADLPENARLYFDMTSGAVKGEPNDYTVEMKPKGCAGIDYILKKAK